MHVKNNRRVSSRVSHREYACIVAAFAAGVLMVTALAACSSPASNRPSSASDSATSSASAVTVNVAAMKGPTGMSLAGLMNQSDQKKTEQSYNFSMVGSPDAITGPLAQGKIDIAVLSTNLAAVMYNKTKGDVQLAATMDPGMFYLISGNPEVMKLSDLAGKTILSTGKGTTPQLVIDKVLADANLTDEVKVDYRSQPTEITSLMATTPNDVALLPEPFVSAVMAANPEIHIVDDLNKSWQRITGSQLATDCVVVRTDFVKQHPDAVKTFLSEYTDAVQSLNEHPDQAAPLIVKQGLVPNAAVAQEAIVRANFAVIPALDAKPSVEEFLKVLFDSNPDSLGGAMPGDDFYYDD